MCRHRLPFGPVDLPFRASRTFFVLLLLLSVEPAAPALAQRGTSAERTEAEYSALIENAVLEFEQEHYPEARALFERAHAVMPNARTLRGIGKAAFEMRDYPAAWAALRESLASSVRPLTPSMRSEAEELVRRCETFVGRAVLRGAPAGAVLTVDGAEAVRDDTGALLLAPGTHRIEILVGDADRLTQPVESVAGRTLVVDVVPAPASAAAGADAQSSVQEDGAGATASRTPSADASSRRASRRAIGLFVGAGAAAALAVGGGIYWADRADALSACRSPASPGDSCTNEDTLVRLRNTGMALTLVGSVAAPTLAIAGWLVRRRSARPAERGASFVCAPAWAGASCAGRF